MSTQSEAALEDQLLRRLSSLGYSKIKLTDALSLSNFFREQLAKHNNTTFTDAEFKRIMTHLAGGSVFEKAKKLRGKFELPRKNGVKYIEFLNTKEWCKNIYHVTHQLTNRQGRYQNRYDVTILINGLPLVQIELKRRGMEIKKAFNQVVRYKKDSLQHGLFAYIQLFVISNGVNSKYFANNKIMNSEQVFYWTDYENNRITQLDQFADEFLEPCHLSKMITKYTVLHQADKALMVLRPYQFYAAEAILKRVEETVKNGYIWHTTGSGKTLTSFKTSQLLTESDKVNKIIFVVDRKDLDYQTTKEFNYFSEGSVEGTEDTKSLVRQLASENKLVITTIQKLTNAVKKDRHAGTMQKVKDQRVVFIFDECHRSQFGEMHRMITNYFTNHQCFGFTGTPIMAVNASNGRTTRDLFGDRLHQYVIKNAINDGNVLGFSVEYNETFHEKDNIKDLKVEGINRQEVFESTERMECIVDHVLLNHRRKTFNKEFTAIFATPSIAVLIKYYELFKKRNHNLSIATIFSFGINEDPDEERDESSRDKLEEFMQDYNRRFGTNFTTRTADHRGFGRRGHSNDFNAYYVDVAKKVREKKIDILLVVSMFLTGFDSPGLNTLYVDKNLQYHGLIQAYSRTNRILNARKRHGNIVCYRNLKQQTDEAVRLYSDKDAIDIVIMKSYEEYLKDFKKSIEKLMEKYPEVSAIDRLEGETAKKEFVLLFRNILRIKIRLVSFSEYCIDDLGIDEQKLADFTSKYRDLYEGIIFNEKVEQVSILEDLDFEIEMLRRDDINVDYILELLKNLNPEEGSFEKDKQYILQIMDRSPELKSKKELIDQFMMEVMIPGGDVEGDLESFLVKERAKALTELADSEQLDPKKLQQVLEELDFTGRINESLLEEAFRENLGFLDRIKKRDSLLIKIKKIIEKFSF